MRRIKRDIHMHLQVLTRPERAHGFIEEAIRQGFAEICATDHAPIPINHAADRIPAGQVGRYVEEVLALREAYRGRIHIAVGIEVDYFPDYEDYWRGLLAPHAFDHVLCSSHLHVRPDFPFEDYDFAGIERLSLEHTLRGVQSGLFDVAAHLDRYRCYAELPSRLRPGPYSGVENRALLDAVLEEIKRRGMMLEINVAGTRHTFADAYPTAATVERAAGLGIPLVYASDAHVPEHVGWQYDALCGQYPACNRERSVPR